MNIDILADDLVSIRELDFIGRAAFSPEGRFTAAYADSYRTPDGVLHGGGFRSSGSGRVILFETGRLVWQREIPRPTSVAVTAQGHVLIADLAFGLGLQSTIHIVDVNGRAIVQQDLKALLADCAATEDQKFALFTSHGSETDTDSSKLFVYSLETGAMLFKSQSYIANIETCFASHSERTVVGDGLICRYSITGEIVNADEIDFQLFGRALESGYLPTAFFCLERKSALRKNL